MEPVPPVAQAADREHVEWVSVDWQRIDRRASHDADPIVFRDTVYPILLRDCGFAGCHGTHERFFSVFGPGRTRLDPATGIYDPATPTELSLSFTRARSMILPEDPESSLLLRKPLTRDEGGAGHKGDDVWGGPVFRTAADARFAALYHWATGR